MASSVKEALWTSPDIKPPTPGDDALREKHVRESVPYNTSHAVDHLDAVVEQLKKLSMIDKPGAEKLANESSKRVQDVIKKYRKYGGSSGR